MNHKETINTKNSNEDEKKREINDFRRNKQQTDDAIDDFVNYFRDLFLAF